MLGVAVLVAVLTGLVGQTMPRGARGASDSSDTPPAVVTVVATPAPGTASAQQASTAATAAAIVAPAGTPQQKRALASFVRYTDTQTHIPEAWMSGFYPIYAQAQSVFGVDWLLLASIHHSGASGR